MGISDIFKAMQYGNEIKDPATWKRGQMMTTAVGGLLVLILQYAAPNFNAAPEFLSELTNVIVGLMILVNLIITKASSKKV